MNSSRARGSKERTQLPVADGCWRRVSSTSSIGQGNWLQEPETATFPSQTRGHRRLASSDAASNSPFTVTAAVLMVQHSAAPSRRCSLEAATGSVRANRPAEMSASSCPRCPFCSRRLHGYDGAPVPRCSAPAAIGRRIEIERSTKAGTSHATGPHLG